MAALGTKTRVCVIGAGPGGITTLRALQAHLDENLFQVVCFERYDRIGGIWNFRAKEGVEEDGLEVHSGMYYSLISNGPKEAQEIPDHLFPLSDPDLTGYHSFPDRVYYLKYFNEYVEKYGLAKYIRFNSWVDWVKYDSASGKFEVTSRDLKAKETRDKEPFDYVIVATGHFNYPNMISFPGQDSFTGQIIHSKQFLDANRFKGKRIVTVGSSYSAEDMALQAVKSGAERVSMSHRTRPIDTRSWPEGIDQKAYIKEMEGSTVRFMDGTEGEYDVIILCTGYLIKFPFLDSDIRLECSNRMAPPLYMQIVHPRNPKVFYIGMQDQFYSFPMFWLHGHFSAKVIKGDITIPPEEERFQEISESQKEEATLKTKEDSMYFQNRHVNEISRLTGQVSIDASNVWIDWLANRRNDITAYKQKTHKSVHRDENGVPKQSR